MVNAPTLWRKGGKFIAPLVGDKPKAVSCDDCPCGCQICENGDAPSEWEVDTTGTTFHNIDCETCNEFADTFMLHRDPDNDRKIEGSGCGLAWRYDFTACGGTCEYLLTIFKFTGGDTAIELTLIWHGDHSWAVNWTQAVLGFPEWADCRGPNQVVAATTIDTDNPCQIQFGSPDPLTGRYATLTPAGA